MNFASIRCDGEEETGNDGYELPEEPNKRTAILSASSKRPARTTPGDDEEDESKQSTQRVPSRPSRKVTKKPRKMASTDVEDMTTPEVKPAKPRKAIMKSSAAIKKMPSPPEGDDEIENVSKENGDADKKSETSAESGDGEHGAEFDDAETTARTIEQSKGIAKEASAKASKQSPDYFEEAESSLLDAGVVEEGHGPKVPAKTTRRASARSTPSLTTNEDIDLVSTEISEDIYEQQKTSTTAKRLTSRGTKPTPPTVASEEEGYGPKVTASTTRRRSKSTQSTTEEDNGTDLLNTKIIEEVYGPKKPSSTAKRVTTTTTPVESEEDTASPTPATAASTESEEEGYGSEVTARSTRRTSRSTRRTTEEDNGTNLLNTKIIEEVYGPKKSTTAKRVTSPTTPVELEEDTSPRSITTAATTARLRQVVTGTRKTGNAGGTGDEDNEEKDIFNGSVGATVLISDKSGSTESGGESGGQSGEGGNNIDGENFGEENQVQIIVRSASTEERLSETSSATIQIAAECKVLSFHGKKLGIIKDVHSNNNCIPNETKGGDLSQSGRDLKVRIVDRRRGWRSGGDKCLDNIIELLVDGMYVSVQADNGLSRVTESDDLEFTTMNGSVKFFTSKLPVAAVEVQGTSKTDEGNAVVQLRIPTSNRTTASSEPVTVQVHSGANGQCGAESYKMWSSKRSANQLKANLTLVGPELSIRRKPGSTGGLGDEDENTDEINKNKTTRSGKPPGGGGDIDENGSEIDNNRTTSRATLATSATTKPPVTATSIPQMLLTEATVPPASVGTTTSRANNGGYGGGSDSYGGDVAGSDGAKGSYGSGAGGYGGGGYSDHGGYGGGPYQGSGRFGSPLGFGGIYGGYPGPFGLGILAWGSPFSLFWGGMNGLFGFNGANSY